MVDAQTWLQNFPNWKTAKVLYGTIDHLKWDLQETNIQELDGDLTIDGLNDLEELDLWKAGKLDNITIRNCPKLEIINLGNSGVKKLNLGPGLDGLLCLEVSIDFINDPSRKLNELDLSQVRNLKLLKCHGDLTTNLLGVEELVQLQHFETSTDLNAKSVVLLPTKGFKKWKENLNIITDPKSGLDLLKGGLGTDKDDVDTTKLNGYKNRPASDDNSDKIKAVLGLKPTDNLPPDWDQKIVSKDKYDKIEKLHDAVVKGAENRFGKNDWKSKLEIENYYNKIEASNK